MSRNYEKINYSTELKLQKLNYKIIVQNDLSAFPDFITIYWTFKILEYCGQKGQNDYFEPELILT